MAGALPDDVAIQVSGVSKRYKLYNSSGAVLSEVLMGRKDYTLKPVLEDISLTIKRGEVVGIIGRNGAGKSTLLKMIAGTLQPSEGAIALNGRVSAILELGTGFNPAYSGRDNVIMSALMRGMTEQEVKAKFDQIVAFSGLEDVIDQPFHTYSSGMQARLAFAAAVAVEADIIIIDEALAAGDTRFTARSLRRVREIAQSGVTALFVSHQTYHVMQLCSRAIWLEDGRVLMDGAPIDVCRAYEYDMAAAIAQDEGRQRPPPPSAADAEITAPRLVETPPKAAPELHKAPQHAPPESPPPQAAPAPNPEPAPVRAEQAPILAATPAPAAPPLTASPPPAPAPTGHFAANEYRITKIEFLDKYGEETLSFRFGEPFRLRVHYECLLDELPDASCGVAAAFTSVGEMQHVMYFNTNYPHSDQELERYDEAAFRQVHARQGVIEANIPFLQVKAGEYYVSVGILPNRTDLHQFYEFQYLAHKITVLANGFPEPSVFYPMVEWSHAPAIAPPQRATAGRR